MGVYFSPPRRTTSLDLHEDVIDHHLPGLFPGAELKLYPRSPLTQLWEVSSTGKFLLTENPDVREVTRGNVAALGSNSTFSRPCSAHLTTLFLLHPDTCSGLAPTSAHALHPGLLPESLLTSASLMELCLVSHHGGACWPHHPPYTL